MFLRYVKIILRQYLRLPSGNKYNSNYKQNKQTSAYIR